MRNNFKLMLSPKKLFEQILISTLSKVCQLTGIFPMCIDCGVRVCFRQFYLKQTVLFNKTVFFDSFIYTAYLWVMREIIHTIQLNVVTTYKSTSEDFTKSKILDYTISYFAKIGYTRIPYDWLHRLLFVCSVI